MNVGEHSANERVSALSTTDNDSAAARQAQPINSFFKPDQVPVASPADFAAVQSTAAAAGTTTDPNTAATARAQQPVASLLAAAPAAHTRIAEESTRVCPTAVAGSAAAVQLTCSGAFPIPLSTSAYRYLPVSFSCRITPLEDSATVASTDSRTTSVTIRPHHNTTLLERAAGTGICSGSSQAVFFTPPFITPLNTTPLHPLRVCRSGITPHTLSDPFLACARGTLSPGLHKIPHPPQETTPGGIFFKDQNVITGVWFLLSYTVGTQQAGSLVHWFTAASRDKTTITSNNFNLRDSPFP